jgi:hypothetical protein
MWIFPSDHPTSAGHFRELYPLSDWFGMRRSVAIGMRKEACDGIHLGLKESTDCVGLGRA